MTKTPITLQDLRRRLYVKAKAEPSWRFWGLYAHVCKRETLRAAYELAKQNDGAPGTDGATFEAIEAEGVEPFLDRLREELVQRRYRPQRLRKVGIPQEGGKVRQLSIPTIRDRVVQGALKLILEPIFEADFQPGSYGYRPKQSAHAAVQRVSVSNSLSGGDRELHEIPAVGDPTHPVQMRGSARASTGERQRRVAVQGGMAACRVVVALKLAKLPLKITAIPEQHMVEEFSAHRPNQALHEWM
jgi:RNA-directed DNA polymerase